MSFIRFPQKKDNLKKCRRWAFLCGRQDFTAKSVTPFTFICSKHFPLAADLNFRRIPSLEPYPHFGKPKTPRASTSSLDSTSSKDSGYSTASGTDYSKYSRPPPVRTYGRKKRQVIPVHVNIPIGVAEPAKISGTLSLSAKKTIFMKLLNVVSS